MARKKQMAEINVVPYIDVMLVLLVIFMITAPLLTQGVNVDLPQASANAMEADSKEPIIVTVNAEGDYYLSVGEDTDTPISDETLVKLVAAVLRAQPGTPVLIRGDGRVRVKLGASLVRNRSWDRRFVKELIRKSVITVLRNTYPCVNYCCGYFRLRVEAKRS